jgi:predicted AAA+ superfamily ATPase
LTGHPANNVLLYGDRGTGPVVHHQGTAQRIRPPRLRLIEVQRHHRPITPRSAPPCAAAAERFILFIDDLSFDENETAYKDLKAILEAEWRSGRTTCCSTPPRTGGHLVQGRFSDRNTAANDDEIHTADTAQEKLSLSDRFGITVTFLAPDQQRFLRIVEELAAERGLALAGDELRARAIAWAARHNGRSGRTGAAIRGLHQRRGRGGAAAEAPAR